MMKQLFSTMLLIAASSALYVNSAQAAVRHCDGFIRVTHNGDSINAIRFTGRGAETHPNDARREARGRLNRCFNAQWGNRWALLGSTLKSHLPGECNNSNISNVGWWEVDIKKRIETVACVNFRDSITSSADGVHFSIERGWDVQQHRALTAIRMNSINLD